MLHEIAAALLAASFVVPVTAGIPENCGANQWSGCEVINTGSTVELSEEHDSNSTAQGNSSKAPVHRAPSPSAAPIDCVTDTIACRDTYSVVMLPTPHAEDLAAFTPQRPTLSAEPDGVGFHDPRVRRNIPIR